MRPKKPAGNSAQELKTVLEIHKEKHAYLVGIAFKIAVGIAKKNGEVSSSEVWAKLYEKAHKNENFEVLLQDADPRWMGAVFTRKNWTRVRWETEDKRVVRASHFRPASVWRYTPNRTD